MNIKLTMLIAMVLLIFERDNQVKKKFRKSLSNVDFAINGNNND